MENKQSVENTISVISFLGTLAKSIQGALANDNKISFVEVIGMVPDLIKLPGVLAAIKDVPAELTDEITAEEKAQLVATIKATGCIPEKASAAVEDGLKIMIDLKNYIFTYFVHAGK